MISELATADLDPDEILNDPEEAAMMAQIIGMQNVRQETGELNLLVSNPEYGRPFRTPQLRTWKFRDWCGNIGTGDVPASGKTSFTGTNRPAEITGAGGIN